MRRVRVSGARLASSRRGHGYGKHGRGRRAGKGRRERRDGRGGVNGNVKGHTSGSRGDGPIVFTVCERGLVLVIRGAPGRPLAWRPAARGRAGTCVVLEVLVPVLYRRRRAGGTALGTVGWWLRLGRSASRGTRGVGILKIVVPVFGVLYAFQRSGRARLGPVVEYGSGRFRQRRRRVLGRDAWTPVRLDIVRVGGGRRCWTAELEVFIPVLCRVCAKRGW